MFFIVCVSVRVCVCLCNFSMCPLVLVLNTICALIFAGLHFRGFRRLEAIRESINQ